MPFHERAAAEIAAHFHARESGRDVRPADGRGILELELRSRDDAPAGEEDPCPRLGALVRAQRLANDARIVQEGPAARRERGERE